jgi:hypothetical protein
MLGPTCVFKAYIFNILLTWQPLDWTSYLLFACFHYVHVFNLSQLQPYGCHLVFFIHTFNLQ